MNIERLAGLAGVSPHETERARYWGQRLEWPMLVVAIWIPIQWSMEEARILTGVLSTIADWLVWLAFIFETTILTTLVKDKLSYLRHNWMNLAIIAAGVPIIWGYAPVVGTLRMLRLLLVLGLLLRVSHTLRVILSRNSLGSTLLFAAIVTVVAGALMARVDPAVETPWDGIWWALVTITTVGYGDIVPVTVEGKLFASLLILGGVVLFALLTANISAFLVARSSETEEKDIREHLREIQVRLEKIERQLKERDPRDE